MHTAPTSDSTTDPDKALGGSMDPDISVASGDSVGHYINMASVSSMAHRHPCGFSLQYRPQTSKWPLVVTQAVDINTGLNYSRTSDPDMVLGVSMDPDITTALWDGTGFSQQHGPRWQLSLHQKHRPWTSA